MKHLTLVLILLGALGLSLAHPGGYGHPLEAGDGSYLLAAIDAPSYIKARADNVCLGQNDDLMIEAALAQGKVVELSEGNFYFGKSVGRFKQAGIWRDNTTLKGQGASTILHPKVQAVTTLTSSIPTGVMSLPVSSTVGFTVSETVAVTAIGSDGETVTIASIGAGVLNLTSPTLIPHPQGGIVSSNGNTLDIYQAQYITIKGLAIDDGGSSWQTYNQMCLHFWAIMAYYSQYITIDNVVILNTRARINRPWAGNAIILASTNDSTVRNSFASGDIKHEDGSRAIIQGNHLLAGGRIYGEYLELPGEGMDIYAQNILKGGNIMLAPKTHPGRMFNVAGNVIDTPPPGQDGILINGGTRHIISSNLINGVSGGGNGIRGLDTTYTSVMGNNISGTWELGGQPLVVPGLGNQVVNNVIP